MSGFYLNYFSVASLILVAFNLSLAIFFLIIPKKSRATVHLGMGYLFLALFQFGYFFSYSWYQPLAAYHRWITVVSILLAFTHINLFMVSYPDARNPRVERVLGIALYLTAIACTLVFMAQTLHGEKVFNFEAHYWDFNAAGPGKLVALVCLLLNCLLLGVFAWRILTVKKRERLQTFLVGLAVLGGSFAPAVLNIMVRNGLISRVVFQLDMDIFHLCGFFLLAILYINITKDRTTFMAKIIGISVVTFMILLQVISFLYMRNEERYYDTIHRQLARLALSGDSRSPEIEYSIGCPGANGAQRKGGGERRYRIDPDGRTHYVAYLLEDPKSGRCAEVGFSYEAYRSFMHPSSKMLIILMGCALAFIIFGFPLFLMGSLIKPLNRLLEGHSRVMTGDFDFCVPVQVADEIGYLTGSFNKMIQTIDTAKRELDSYANDLESMVKRRTMELERARDLLWGEMQLAKKIQTVLLPEKPLLEGYEIAVYMHPADVVGGDYYDVISVDNYNWLVIGDVSGHGVPAGLIMMMVQTSINVIIEKRPDLEPAKLLSIINRTIRKNIARLGEDKYMTITVFAVFPGGRFVYSGLHQDILIYRAGSRSVDVIPTRGSWLGLQFDLGRDNYDDSFTLEKGDVLLLYTDGITEAWEKRGGGKENDDRIMFGRGKLRDLLRERGSCSPEDIKNAIIAALRGYDREDDVTLMIVKHAG